MARKTLRDECRPRIARVLEATKGQTEREIRRALREAFPWGIRKYWPYKVWLSEIRRQRKMVRWRDDFGEGSLFAEAQPGRGD